MLNSVWNQRKFLEKGHRINNLAIVGLEDKRDTKNTVSVINNFLVENLKLTDIRLKDWVKSKRNQGVAFNSPSNKKAVLSYLTKLAGSDIYTNLDLTIYI